MKEILSHLLADTEARSLVSDSFPKMHINDKINVSVKAMCRVAAKKLLNNVSSCHKYLCMYNFIANIFFLLLFVNYFFFSSRERKWSRMGRRQEERPKGRAEKYNKFKNL